MAAIQSLKKQLKGIRSTQKLTKAMKTISTVKFSKLNGLYSDYSAYGKECAALLSQFGGAFEASIGMEAPDAPAAVVVIAGNKGLCGSFNAELLHFAESKLEEFDEIKLYTCGKKASQYFKGKKRPLEREAVFADLPDYDEVSSLLEELLERRNRGEIGRICVIYPEYRNMMIQRPVIRDLFSAPEKGAEAPCLYFPDQQTLVDRAAKTIFRAVFYGWVLEAAIGAQAATLMTMRSAFDTATEYCAQLEGQINRQRQSAVTADVIETSSERSES